MAEKHAVTRKLAEGYRRAGKLEKGAILDTLCSITGYSRDHAARLLRAGPPPKWPKKNPGKNRTRPRVYDVDVLFALRKVWATLDELCGKRLAAARPHMVIAMERHGELMVSAEVRQKLLAMSAATIDRLLAPDRAKLALKGRTGTKPGTLLKHQIPIKTFADWDDTHAGFVEIDLVGHDGGVLRGEYCQTLDVTDVATGWTETRAVRNKAQVHVFAALKEIRTALPFPVLGIDSDNGSEFINHELFRYCEEKHITFTRSRAYKKNDGCYVEQKNWSVVRRNVGYARFDTPEELACLNELYTVLREHTNYFMPSAKLVSKTREGAKVTKRYDTPQTPYSRVLASEHVTQATKRRLTRRYEQLNPVALKRTITDLQKRLYELVSLKESIRRREVRASDLDDIYDESTNARFDDILR
ncbi:MAG: transposase family protein [Coriobacteriia bacterium]|nr:transposase family protein [Coriobacteriia bacterium]